MLRLVATRSVMLRSTATAAVRPALRLLMATQQVASFGTEAAGGSEGEGSVWSEAKTPGGIQRIFDFIDGNADGVIQPCEIQEWLEANGVHLTKAQVYELYSKHDANGDGVLQKDEFTQLFYHVRKIHELRTRHEHLKFIK